MAAANRDEGAWAGADELDVGRSPNPHLAFGVGPHSCLGQPLARTELQAVLTVLLRRLPTLDLAVAPGTRAATTGCSPPAARAAGDLVSGGTGPTASPGPVRRSWRRRSGSSPSTASPPSPTGRSARRRARATSPP
ncbi:cytochrome P450 [Streptomyces sp. M19]